MSQENVEICKRLFEAAVPSRDTEAALPYIDPEIELQSAIIGGAEGNTYRGHEGFREWVAESDATFAELRLEPDEWRDLGGDDVLLIGRAYARGRESGVEIDSPPAWLFTFPRRQNRACAGIPQHPGSPRSRRAVGLGDVAGERGVGSTRDSKRGSLLGAA